MLLLVEDDPPLADMIVKALKNAFPSHDTLRLATELQFRTWLTTADHDVPAVIVMDIMLRWTDPREHLEAPPEDVRRDGFFVAGLRCVGLLQRSNLNDVPVILYTVLESADVQKEMKRMSIVSSAGGIAHLRKDGDVSQLVGKVAKIIKGRGRRPPQDGEGGADRKPLDGAGEGGR